jgi:hypothetical protein
LSWDEFVLAWSEAHDGYDLRRASGGRQRFMRAIYRISGAVRVRTSVAMWLSVGCSICLLPLASKGGLWAVVAALVLLLGQVTDTMTSARAVRSGHVTRLEQFYQVLVERFAEVCWLVALLALGARHVAVVLCAFVVWAHEYLRAKVGGTATRRAGTATIGHRGQRVWIVVVALLLAALVSWAGADVAAGVVTMVVMCWLTLGVIGVAQLFTVIRKALT